MIRYLTSGASFLNLIVSKEVIVSAFPDSSRVSFPFSWALSGLLFNAKLKTRQDPNGIHQNLTDFEVDMATIVPLI